ncbi:MAG TPA: hypothetical protein VFB08_19375 [Burkholderiales bacterium]|nr:hypothetical protein [Burkholderiales bacterium]
MGRQIIVYGHGDKSENGFRTPQALVDYLEGGIFEDEDGRYRYSQTKPADVIVVAREGLAFGHLEADEAVNPSREDREVYPRVKKVYLIRKSVSYAEPVRLAALGISNYRFGRYIDEEQFAGILQAAGKVTEHRGS